MNTQDMSAIGAIPRKATVPLDRPITSLPRPIGSRRLRIPGRRVPAGLRTDAGRR